MVDVGPRRRGLSSAPGAGVSSAPSLVAGKSLLFSGSQSSGAASFGDVDWFDGLTAITVGAVVLRQSTTSEHKTVTKWGIADNQSFLLSLSNGSSSVVWAIETTGGLGVWTSTHSTPANTPLVLGATWNSTANALVACNGLVQKPSAGGFGALDAPLRNGSTVFQVGTDQENNGPLNGACGLVPIWGRALSEQELHSFTLNPWQLFEPRRIFVPMFVASSGVPVLSAATAFNVTATTAQPRVTITF